MDFHVRAREGRPLCIFMYEGRCTIVEDWGHWCGFEFGLGCAFNEAGLSCVGLDWIDTTRGLHPMQ